MDDLVRWLGQQLDEDERIAREAAPGPWRHDPERIDFLMSAEQGYVVDCSGARAAAENAAHIAAHDPARVLREIDAKRQMITGVAASSASALDMEHGCCHEPEQILDGECPQFPPDDLPLLRLLALPYADRPGYLEKWRP